MRAHPQSFAQRVFVRLLDAIVDRSRQTAGVSVAAAAIAFLAGLIIAGGEITDATSFVIAVTSGAVVALIGFVAASRVRPMDFRPNSARVRLAVLALLCGAVLGIANLAANGAIAAAHPTLRALMKDRVADVESTPLKTLVAAPLVEEILLRLFFLSVVAWGISRLTRRTGVVLWTALAISSFAFALLHLDRAFPADPALATLYAVALLTKYTLAGMALGWIYWRWGLPYVVLCHSAANAAHLLLQPMIL